MTRWLGLAVVALLLLAGLSPSAPQSIVDSPHNLSSSGPGPVNALDEDRVCIFCHTPHGSRTNAPLWNRRDSSAFYIPYDSPTLRAKPGQPTGTSKLCLSCHDGTVALGDLVSLNAPLAMGGSQTISSDGGLIGTDLRDDHPISFAYVESLAGSNGELASPQAWDSALQLDGAGMLQCTTCHDPHDNEWGQFLVMPNNEAGLCRQCHTISGFDGTSHATSGETWTGVGRNPWPHTEFGDVASNSCMNCHRSHHAPGPEELLTAERQEDVCFACHSGSVGQTDLRASFAKPFRHPVAETGAAHRPGESPREAAGHVTCVDCHNPHRASDRPAGAPYVMGVLEGVSGISAAGTPLDEVQFEYEVCFKCHSEDHARDGWQSIVRQVGSTRLIDQFSAASPSAHPVVVARPDADVPSLIAPMNETSMIYCSDCHGDDAAPDSSGFGAPAGPHGSRFEFLLKREYRTGEFVTESPSAYALCYGCHDRSSILSNESFPGHREHIVNQRTSCATCHNAHGIDPAAGNRVNNSHLMDFDLAVVQPHSASGLLEYVSGGEANCTLKCHGVEHDAASY